MPMRVNKCKGVVSICRKSPELYCEIMFNFIENAWGMDARKKIRITWGQKR